MAKHFSKSTGTRDELLITLYLQPEIIFYSVSFFHLLLNSFSVTGFCTFLS